MKHSVISILFIIFNWSSIQSQIYVILPDSLNYNLIELSDTLDIDHSEITPFPNTADLDVDCDGIADIQVDMYPIPVMVFPPEHHIDLVNLVGNDLEILADDEWAQAFRSNDTVALEANTDWESRERWKVLRFFVISGATWAGVSGTDSVYVNDMYILFRKRIQGEWVYGWINYSGKSWPAELYLRHHAIENAYCMPTSTDPVRLPTQWISCFPNPAKDILFLDPDLPLPFPVTWNIISGTGTSVAQGVLSQGGEAIHLSPYHLTDGLYSIYFRSPSQQTQWVSRILILH